MYDFKQLDRIKAFQRYVLGHLPSLREFGRPLLEQGEPIRSLQLGRLTVPNYGVDSTVMLLDEWPVAPAEALAGALETVNRLEYAAVFRPDPSAKLPPPGWSRIYPACDIDHYTVPVFQIWREGDDRIGLLYQARTADLFGTFATDYLTAVVLQDLLATVTLRKTGTLQLQGALHLHERDAETLEALQARDVDVNWTRYTRWNEFVLVRYRELLDDYSAQTAEVPRTEDRFRLLKHLAKSAAISLTKGVLSGTN